MTFHDDDSRHWRKTEKIHGAWAIAWAIQSSRLPRMLKAKVEDKGQLLVRQVLTEIVRGLDHIAESVKWWSHPIHPIQKTKHETSKTCNGRAGPKRQNQNRQGHP